MITYKCWYSVLASKALNWAVRDSQGSASTELCTLAPPTVEQMVHPGRLYIAPVNTNKYISVTMYSVYIVLIILPRDETNSSFCEYLTDFHIT